MKRMLTVLILGFAATAQAQDASKSIYSCYCPIQDCPIVSMPLEQICMAKRVPGGEVRLSFDGAAKKWSSSESDYRAMMRDRRCKWFDDAGYLAMIHGARERSAKRQVKVNRWE